MAGSWLKKKYTPTIRPTTTVTRTGGASHGAAPRSLPFFCTDSTPRCRTKFYVRRGSTPHREDINLLYRGEDGWSTYASRGQSPRAAARGRGTKGGVKD